MLESLHGVVFALAGAVHHARYIRMLWGLWNTLTSVPVTRAGAPYHHAGDAIVVLLHHCRLVLQQVVVTKGVKASECEPEVSRLQKILHLLAVRVESRIVQLDVGRKHSVDDLGSFANLCLNLCHISPLRLLMG